MAIDKVPPALDENPQKTVSDILDYLYYLREQINYELAVAKKTIIKEADNNAKTEEKLVGAINALDKIENRLKKLENA